MFLFVSVLGLNVPVINFSAMSGRSHCFLGFNQYSREFMYLAQGHNSMTLVGIEPRFEVRCPTTTHCFILRFNVPVNNFAVMLGRSHRFLGFNKYSRELMCLAQGHNSMTLVGIEPRFEVRCSTTTHCFILRFNVPVNNFSVMLGRSHRFLGFNKYSRELINVSCSMTQLDVLEQDTLTP